MAFIGKIMLPFTLLRVEGGVLLAASIGVYWWGGGNWLLFIALLLGLDLSMLGYLVNVRVGAIFYNLVHLTVWPLFLVSYSVIFTTDALHSLAFQLALIWFGHVGMDRLTGSGLKYPTRFNDTHLQHV